MRRSDDFHVLPANRQAVWSGFLRWEQQYFPSFVGLELEEVRLDYARIRLPWRTELTQPAGVVHGGALATLIDSVVVPAIGSGYDEPRGFSTVSMSVQFRSAVVGEDMIAEGWVVQRGRSIVFCEAEVTTGSGVVAATGQLVYKLASKRA